MTSPSVKPPRSPWLTAAFGLSIATLVLCALSALGAFGVFLILHGQVSEAIDMGPDYWVMLSDGMGTGIDVAIIEGLFGEHPGIPTGLLITFVNATISFLWFALTAAPLAVAALLLRRLNRDRGALLPKRLWVTGALSALLTLQPLAAILFLLVAFASAKGRCMVNWRIAKGCIATGIAALGCCGACVVYVAYADSEVQGLMEDIKQITERQTPVDIMEEMGPDIHFAPDFNQTGERISTVTVTHGLPVLLGNSGTMMVYIEETYDKTKTDLTDQHDSLRLWLEKVNGEWRIVDYYWHL